MTIVGSRVSGTAAVGTHGECLECFTADLSHLKRTTLMAKVDLNYYIHPYVK